MRLEKPRDDFHEEHKVNSFAGTFSWELFAIWGSLALLCWTQ